MRPENDAYGPHNVIAGASIAALLAFAAPAMASYKAEVQSGTLELIGNGAADKLSLAPSPSDPGQLLVDVGEDGTTDFAFNGSRFDAIDVQAGGGNDTIDASNGLTGFGPLTIDGGPGNDTIRGGDGNDVLIGGDVPTPPRRSRCRRTARACVCSANVDLSGTPGGGGDGAADSVVVNGTAGPDNVDVGSDGGHVVVSGLTTKVEVTGAESSQDTVGVDALGGDDLLTSGVGGTGPVAIALDGAAGDDTATYSGTSGADTIDVVNDGTAARTFAPGDSPQDPTGGENLVVQGLGSDTQRARQRLAAGEDPRGQRQGSRSLPT